MGYFKSILIGALFFTLIPARASHFCTTAHIRSIDTKLTDRVQASGITLRPTDAVPAGEIILTAENGSAAANKSFAVYLLADLVSKSDYVFDRPAEIKPYMEQALENLKGLDLKQESPTAQNVMKFTIKRLNQIFTDLESAGPRTPVQRMASFHSVMWDAIVALHFAGQKVLVGKTVREIFPQFPADHAIANQKIHVAVQRNESDWDLIEIKSWPKSWLTDPAQLRNIVDQSVNISKMDEVLPRTRLRHLLVLSTDLREVREIVHRMGAELDQTHLLTAPMILNRYP